MVVSRGSTGRRVPLRLVPPASSRRRNVLLCSLAVHKLTDLALDVLDVLLVGAHARTAHHLALLLRWHRSGGGMRRQRRHRYQQKEHQRCGAHRSTEAVIQTLVGDGGPRAVAGSRGHNRLAQFVGLFLRILLLIADGHHLKHLLGQFYAPAV